MRLTGQWELSITPSAMTLPFTVYRYTTYRYMMADTTEIVQKRLKLRKDIHYPDSKES